MAYKIYTYADPYRIRETDFWNGNVDHIKDYPQLCASRTLVNGLISVMREDIESLICPLDDIVNEKIFRTWTNDIGVRILQYSELSAVYRRWNQKKKLSDDLYIALTHNKDEMLDSLRLFIELGIDSSSLKTDGLSMEHRLFAYMLKMTENESLFKLPQLPNLPEIISLFKKQVEDEKAEKETIRNEHMDTDDSKLWEQEEMLLNRMIESTNHWDGKHVVIHGIHQFTPLQLRFITHLDKLGVEVIFVHNYVPEYKEVYSSWSYIYQQFNAPVHHDRNVGSYVPVGQFKRPGNAIASNLGLLCEDTVSRTDKRMRDNYDLYKDVRVQEFDNVSEYAGYISDLILSLEDLDEYCDAMAGKWDMLLVDETHRLLSQDEKYELVLQLSKRVPNALFLSATPIQDRKEEYLKLLSLLQPDQYCRMTVKEFGSILTKQKKIQRRVNAMLAHMNQYEDYKEDTLEKLAELAEELDDTHLSKIIDNINISDDDGGQKYAEQALSYISENYRIERNVIRNRRDYINEVLGKREIYENGYDVKNADDNYSERNVYYALLEYISSKIEEDSINANEVYLLLQAMFSSPWALKDVVDELGIDDQDLLANLGLWITQGDDEINQAEYLLDENPDDIKGRLLHVIDFIEQEVRITKDNNGKVVVFSEFPATLWKLGELLEKRDINAVCFTANMLREELEDSVYDFQNNEECRVILCDATGGEGRNFQNADWVIHVDLPWTANAIEQRIGRLDRLGRDKDHMQVNSVVFYGNGTIEEQLFRIWSEGLNLFTRSLSGLEIITAELNERISDAIFEDVHTGLENALSEIIDMTEETRDAVEEEQLYDSGSVIYRPLSLAVKQMLSTYSGGESDLFQSSMLGWATQVGMGSSISKAGVVQFAASMFKERSAIQSLFIPPDWALYDDTPIVRKEGRILGTFDRSTAIKREDLLFYAPGDPVFDSIIGNAVDSGRGRCCVFANMAPFNFKQIR